MSHACKYMHFKRKWRETFKQKWSEFTNQGMDESSPPPQPKPPKVLDAVSKAIVEAKKVSTSAKTALDWADRMLKSIREEDDYSWARTPKVQGDLGDRRTELEESTNKIALCKLLLAPSGSAAK
eukprot:5467814-Pyramimonas_sp.AAC.1